MDFLKTALITAYLFSLFEFFYVSLIIFAEKIRLFSLLFRHKYFEIF